MEKRRVIFMLAILLLALVGAAIAVNNGASRPIKGHEIFVAETASEMIARGDYLLPYYNGELRIQKPPLAYWLSIAFHSLLGKPGSAIVSEFECRLASLISGMLVLVVTFLLGRAAFDDRRIGLVSAAILGTSWIFFNLSRSARPEMIYALFCTAEMLGLVIAARRHAEGRSTVPGAALAWAAMAAALMTKGPQFPLFLFAGAALALWLRTPRPQIAKILHPAMGLVLLALVLPYFGYLATRVDDAFSLWSRELTQNTPTPVWLRPLRLFYFWAVVKGMIPWLAVFGLGVVHCWKRRHPAALMLVWPILISLVFLSFAGKLREHYVLPLIPLCAVLSAWAAVALFDRARQDADARWLMRKLLLTQAALVGVLLVAVAALSLRENPVTGAHMWPAAAPWLVAATLLAGAAYWLASKRPISTFATLALALLATSAGIATAGLDISRYWGTASAFALELARKVPADRPVIFQGVHSASLIYYGRRIGPLIQLSDWVRANQGKDLPLLVCKEACTLDGKEIEGEVLFKQREIGQGRFMILFKPKRMPLPRQTAPEKTAASEPAPKATAPSGP